MKKTVFVLSAAAVFALVSGCTTYYPAPPPSRPYAAQPHNNHPYKVTPRGPVFVKVSRPEYLVLVPGLSVYFVPHTSAEVFYFGGRWYYRLGAKWYWGRSYRGPWTYVEVRVVPRPLRQVPRDYRSRYRSRYYRVPYSHWKKRKQEPPPRSRYKQPPYMYRDPDLNVYIVPGISADIVFYNGRWYNRYQGVWYTGTHYSGPWGYIDEGKVPRKLWELGPDFRKDVRRYKRVPYGAWKKPGERAKPPRSEVERPQREDRHAARPVPRKYYEKKEPRTVEVAPPTPPVMSPENPPKEAGRKQFLERKAELGQKRMPAQPEPPAVQPPPEAGRRPAMQKPGEKSVGKKRGAPAALPAFDLKRPRRLRFMARRKVYYIPGISRDIFYFKGTWYLRNQGAWYLGGSFNGPWSLIRGKKIPGALTALPGDFRDGPSEDVPYGHWKNEKKGKGKGRN